MIRFPFETVSILGLRLRPLKLDTKRFSGKQKFVKF